MLLSVSYMGGWAIATARLPRRVGGWGELPLSISCGGGGGGGASLALPQNIEHQLPLVCSIDRNIGHGLKILF